MARFPDPLTSTRRDRLRAFCERKGWKNENGSWATKAAADFFGKTTNKISDLLNEKGSFGAAIARDLETNSLGELKAGELDGLLDAAELVSRSLQKIKSGSGDVLIPEFGTGGAMGNGGLVLEDVQPGVIKSWHVDQEWLRLNVPHNTGAKNLCIVTGFGHSMEPVYNPGDPLLCDRGVNVVDGDGVYFFRIGNHGFIKQLQRIPTENGMVFRAKSYNKDFDPFDITPKMDFAVLGKILTAWCSKKMW